MFGIRKAGDDSRLALAAKSTGMAERLYQRFGAICFMIRVGRARVLSPQSSEGGAGPSGGARVCLHPAPARPTMTRPASASVLRERNSMAYVVAAYGLVIGTLVIYGCRVQVQRRQLERAARAETHVASET